MIPRIVLLYLAKLNCVLAFARLGNLLGSASAEQQDIRATSDRGAPLHPCVTTGDQFATLQRGLSAAHKPPSGALALM